MDKISSATSKSVNNQKNEIFYKEEFPGISKNEKGTEKDNNNIINSNNHKSDKNLKTSYPLLFK